MIKLFMRYRLKEWLIIILLICVVVQQVYFNLEIPKYSGEITMKVTMPGSEVSDILFTGLKMLLVSFGSMGCAVIIGFLATFLAGKFSHDLRFDIFKKVESFSFSEINKFSTPSLITRSTNDIQQVQMSFIMIFQMAISAPITAVWAIIKIKNSSAELTLATIIAVLFMILVLTFIFLNVIPKFKTIQKLTDKLNGVTRENISGLRVVKAYNADKYQEEKFDKINRDISKTNLFVNRVMGLMQPFMMLIMNVLILIIYWLGAVLIDQEKLVFPSIIEFVGLSMQTLMAFIMLTMLFIMVPRAQVSAKRISEVLKTESSIKDPLDEDLVSPKKNSKGEIEFVNVSFKYQEAEDYVLKNISFKAKKGETVAIIGSTGSGKSTLINLVPRFYDVSEGKILIDGEDIRNYKQKDLRSKIGYVPQKGILFSGTVKDNINYGKTEINEEEIIEAAKIAMADNFVIEMANKYDSEISQGGKNVSGGQKQRLSIARAIAIEPEIFIFDDSFSALDYKTDKEVRRNLKKYIKDATSLIVAQRIGTILDADLIIVLEQGKLVGAGKHKDLLKTCEIYKEIALSQLTKEELGINE